MSCANFSLFRQNGSHTLGVQQFESRSGPTNAGPDLGPNCLQRLSAGLCSPKLGNSLTEFSNSMAKFDNAAFDGEDENSLNDLASQ